MIQFYFKFFFINFLWVFDMLKFLFWKQWCNNNSYDGVLYHWQQRLRIKVFIYQWLNTVKFFIRDFQIKFMASSTYIFSLSYFGRHFICCNFDCIKYCCLGLHHVRNKLKNIKKKLWILFKVKNNHDWLNLFNF